MRLPRLPARRPSLPADLAAQLNLTDTKVLAWAPLIGGGAVAATVEELRARTPQGASIARPWTQIDHLVWHDDSNTLAVFWVGTRLATPLELDGDTYVPEVAHERWRSSVVMTHEVALPDRRSAWVALRKSPDGALHVQTNLPTGVDAADPAVAERLTGARRRLLHDAGAGLDTPWERDTPGQLDEHP